MILAPTPENIAAACLTLAQGGLVSFPTETVYGLGADATSETAVRAIFLLKGRPSFNPIIVHISTLDSLAQVAQIEPDSKMARQTQLLARFWPGPLSLVLPKNPNLSPSVTAGLSSVAVRIPDHPVALALINQFKRPIAAPSANRSEYISPTCAEHVFDEFGETLQIILDGGPTKVGIESTVVSLVTDSPTILRPGIITKEMIEAALDQPVDLAPKYQTIATSPGMLAKHYAPKTRLCLITHFDPKDQPKRVGLISFAGNRNHLGDFYEKRVLSQAGELEQVASALFSTLRELDKLALDMIVVDVCQSDGLGLAIMDRLGRAITK